MYLLTFLIQFKINASRFANSSASRSIKQQCIKRVAKRNPMAIQTMRSNSTSVRDNFDNKRFSLPQPSSHISSVKSSVTPHVPKRDLYQTSSKIEEYYEMFKKKDEKSRVLKYLLFNGNLKTLREHELKYGD